jgi:site-specific DNA recombinase
MNGKTAIYARYSSHAQDGGTSIEVQLDACARGLEPGGAAEYIDRAKTGRVVAGREALLRLLADAEAGKVGHVLVYKYDRLGRNLAETSAIIAQLEDCNVEVVSATEGKDALARGMHLVISEHYSRVLSERTRDGLVKRFEQRAWTGGPAPYGYRIEVAEDGFHRLKINDDEAETVRWVFETYTSEAVGQKEVAHRLRTRGIRPRRAMWWSHLSVRAILMNSVYTGRITYNRRRFKLDKRTGRRVPVWRDEAEHLVQQDENLRIIDDEQFEAVQQRLALRSREHGGPRLRGEAKPFTGLIFCETCGSVCYRRTAKNHKGEYHYYNCGCRQRNGPDVCSNAASVREDTLVQRIARTLDEVFEDTEAIVEEAVEEARKMLNENREEAQRVLAQLADLDRKVTRLTGLLMDPDIDLAAKKALSRQLGEQETERERLQKAVTEMGERADNNTERLAGAVRQAISEARESLASAATSSELREFVDRWVGPMVLRPDGSIMERTLATEDSSEASVKGLVAGAGFEPATFGL